MANSKVASDFEAIIQAGRDRKKNEALAARIFGKDRRASAPLRSSTPGAGGSLASRAGVNKQRVASTYNARAPQQGNIDLEWTHDLHGTHAPHLAPSTPRGGHGGAGALASRITNPNAPGAAVRQKRRAVQVAQALVRTEQQQQQQQAQQAPLPSSSFSKGLTIRGLAGPFVLMAQNFAPGTTAADIESAVTPVGGIVSSCRVIKTQPIVIAEIVLESKEGADNVIATFDKQTADGRVLQVYYKVGANNTSAVTTQPQIPTAPRAQRDDLVVDGTLGFEDPMDTTNGGGSARPLRAGGIGGGGGLYSDSMVRSNGYGRRGRGFGRGGGRGGPGR